MRVLNGIRWISTITKHPLPRHETPPVVSESSQVFDPDVWHLPSSSDSLNFALTSASTESTSPTEKSEPVEKSHVIENESNNDAPEESTTNQKPSNDIEENRADGHAPIKSALSILMQSLQKTSSMTTSLSDIDVTLFNFHSTIFAERLLNRNVSSVVMVESSHVFSKNAKKFADKQPNVSAYRADIYTLMGVGRKKTAHFPRKLMFADLRKNATPEQYENIRPWTLTSSVEPPPNEDEQRLSKFRRPHLLAVLPTMTIQKTIVDSMIQHALLHHSGLDEDTVFRYGETNLMTFLSSVILSQYTCCTDDRLTFLSHQHRRHSALFNKLFDLKLLQTHPESIEIPIGYKPTSFHPQLPTTKKITHEKKLADVNLRIGLQYPVQITPRTHLTLAGNPVTTENGLGKSLVDFACFLTQIGRQPNAKAVEQVVSTLWPESSLSIPADLLNDQKIGQLPLDHLESIFQHVREELHTTRIAQSYCDELKIKRIVA